MKSLFFFSFFCFLLLNTSLYGQNENVQEQAGHIEWISLEEAQTRSMEAPRKILVDVYTDWCGWCKRMDRDTYEKPEVIKYINEHYYAVKFDAEQKEDITLGDRTFKFIPNGRRGYHELAALMLENRLSYPHTIFFDEKLVKIVAIPGYRGKVEMMAFLHYFKNNVYKTNPNLDAFVEDFRKKQEGK